MADGQDNTNSNTDDFGAELASVFGLSAPAPSDNPPAGEPDAPAAEPGAGVVAPSPAPDAPTPSTVETPAAPTPAPVPVPGLQEQQSALTPTSPPATPTPAAPPSEETLWRNSMEAQLNALRQENERLRAAQQGKPDQRPQPGQPSSDGNGDDGLAPIDYNSLQVPDQLFQAIFDVDNPQQQVLGLNTLVRSLAHTVHQRVRAEQMAVLRQRDEQAASQRSEQAGAEQVRQMQTDYYGTYPQHDNPVTKQIVAHCASELASQYPGLPWGPQYRDALGARVNAELARLAGTPAPTTQTPQPPAPTPAPRPASFAPTGVRSSIPSFENDVEREIADVFGGGFST